MKRRKKVDNGLQIIIKMLNVESSIEFSVSVHLNVCVCVFSSSSAKILHKNYFPTSSLELGASEKKCIFWLSTNTRKLIENEDYFSNHILSDCLESTL